MQDRAALIDRLIDAVAARAGEPGGLHLPGWERADWETLLARADIVELRDGDPLVRRHEGGDDLYFLVSGELEVSVPQSDSLTITPLIRIAPGSTVGEIAFLDKRARVASVWSRGPSVLFVIHDDDFRALRAARPGLAADILQALGRILATRLRRMLGAPGGSAGWRG